MVVNGFSKVDDEDSLSPNKQEKHKRNTKKDLKTLFVLQLVVTNFIFGCVGHATTANEFW